MSLQSLLDKSASAAEVAAYLNSVPFETALGGHPGAGQGGRNASCTSWRPRMRR
jgi:hypothetical protein